MKKNIFKWKVFNKIKKGMIEYGLKTGRVTFYPEEVLDKLRHIYCGGVPVSVILLSNTLKNESTYSGAYLLSLAFLGENDKVRMIFGFTNSSRYNPFIPDNYAHCLVETIEDGKHLIYDTNSGLVYDKEYYNILEKLDVRLVRGKKALLQVALRQEPSELNIDVASKYIEDLNNTYYDSDSLRVRELGNLYQRELAILQDDIETKKKDNSKNK